MKKQIGWNINYFFPQDLEKKMNSVSWRSILFNNSQKIHIPENKRGVYIVSLKSNILDDHEPFSLFETPIYVGHSTGLRARFHAHTTGSDEEALWKRIPFEKKRYCTFRFAIFEDRTPKNNLKEVEQEILNAYGCPLNKINSVSQGNTILGKT